MVEDEVVVVEVLQPPGAVWMSSFILQRNTEEIPRASPVKPFPARRHRLGR
jgi:hypothetical protein